MKAPELQQGWQKGGDDPLGLSPEQQVDLLKRGCVDLHVETELLARLRLGRPLKIKAGFDPTRPDLHLGHAVLLQKMRQFQDFGHHVVFVVGDFTAQIGDPSGRNATRPIPTRQEIDAGAASYAEQAFKILDPQRTEVVYNDSWLGRMSFADVIRLAGKYTLARLMERDDFKTRWAEHSSIALHELLYPLAQGYDSVVLDCDVELGGGDQLFNLLVGRDLMREHGLRPQVVMTTPILEGIQARLENGRLVGDKMSKSLGNAIGLTEAPQEQFGKLMSLSDALMWRYYELLTPWSDAAIADRKRACEAGELNPRDAKIELAKHLVGRFHSAPQAEEVAEAWLGQFSRREVPEDIAEVTVQLEPDEDAMWVPKVLALAGLAKSSTDGRRRLEQGGVSIDGERTSDAKASLPRGGPYLIKAGKRAWARVRVQ